MSTIFRRALQALGAFLLAASTAVGLLAAPAAAGSFEDSPVDWRPYGPAAFDEARETGRLVFLVLTAPWTWDHFLLPDRIFTDEDVVSRIESGMIPVLARADTHPELRSVYSIRSGLLPSFHFLDADARPIASFPPMGVEELVYYLDQFADAAAGATPIEPSYPETLEINPDLIANRAGRLLLSLRETGVRDPFAVHADLDFSDLEFFTEYGRRRIVKRSARNLTRDTRWLLQEGLFDREAGGVHRSAALADGSVAHYEKTLRQNAVLGGVLATWCRVSRSRELAYHARLIVRFLNEEMRIGTGTLYAASLSADVFDAAGQELILEGPLYYELNLAARQVVGEPQREELALVGANFVVHQALVKYFRCFREESFLKAVVRGGAQLLGSGFDPDGAARRVLGEPGAGNLRDQADAGSGLLAYYGVSGDPAGLRAAERLARALHESFWDAETRTFRSAMGQADGLDVFRSTPPDAAWNGGALRFLAELGAVTGDARWTELAHESLAAWAERLPETGYGLAEIGRASMRVERPVAVVLIDADPTSDEGKNFVRLAYGLSDPLSLVRWVTDDDRAELGRALGQPLSDEPAMYLLWDGVVGPIRDFDGLQNAWSAGVERVWPRPEGQ